MTETKYTSQPLSKWLKDNGCELESEAYWASWSDHAAAEQSDCHELHWKLDDYGDYPAYDILNDICCRYADEFWGEKSVMFGDFGAEDVAWSFHSRSILFLLQQGKKQDAEEYIKEHCLFGK